MSLRRTTARSTHRVAGKRAPAACCPSWRARRPPGAPRVEADRGHRSEILWEAVGVAGSARTADAGSTEISETDTGIPFVAEARSGWLSVRVEVVGAKTRAQPPLTSSTTGASASSASIVPGPNMSSACV